MGDQVKKCEKAAKQAEQLIHTVSSITAKSSAYQSELFTRAKGISELSQSAYGCLLIIHQAQGKGSAPPPSLAPPKVYTRETGGTAQSQEYIRKAFQAIHTELTFLYTKQHAQNKEMRRLRHMVSKMVDSSSGVPEAEREETLDPFQNASSHYQGRILDLSDDDDDAESEETHE